jgi:hypothetical protein
VDHFCLYDEKDESVEGGCSILFDQRRLEKGCVFL